MDDNNVSDNKETKISSKAYNESYFMFHKLISELFIFPLIFYILLIAYITHISTFNPPLKTYVSLYLLKKRKILLLILISLFIGEIIAILIISNSESSSSSISNSNTLITLMFYIMNILAALLTIYFIEEKSKKYIKTDKKNYFQIFLGLNIIYFLLDLVNEIVYGRFTFFTPITFCFLIYLQIFYYHNPSDNDHLVFSKGTKFIAVTEIYRGLINRDQSIRKKNENYKNNITLNKRKYIPMSNFSGRISMLGSDNYDLSNDENKKSSRVSSNEGNNKLNSLITKLYDPNNIDYLQNSYEDLLDIKVKFQSNFFIDYGVYNGNKEKDTNKSKDKEKKDNEKKDDKTNSNDKNKPLLNNQNEAESNSDEHFDVANFYTSIIFNFNVIATSSYYVTNKNLSKSLDEFLQLDNIILSEFTEDRYSISLINNLPKLNLKKCFEGLLDDNLKSPNIDSLMDNNNDILINCIQNTKNTCEKYIKALISNPHFIIPEVLIFLEIKDKNVMQIYININKQIKKRDDSILRSLSRKEDSHGFVILGNSNYKYKKGIYISKINIKILSGNFINDKNNKYGNDIKNYILVISINYEECTKFVRKKLEETVFILQEFNKFIYINSKNNNRGNNLKNSRKELNSQLNKNFEEFVRIYNKINGSNFTANQSFKLINNKRNEKVFKKFTFLDFEQDNDIFYSLIKCIENIFQILMNNYLEEIYNSNQIIREYFIDFFESYWDVEILKKYSKSNNNSINLFKNEISGKSINSIFVKDQNYIYININYNVNVFYNLFFKITTESNFIQLEKKYDFEEVKNYIDLMKVELGLSLTWPKRCFESIENDENNVENMHTYRLNLMSSYLNKIFNSNKIFNIKNWKQIFYDDELFRDVCEIKFKEKKVQNKKQEANIEHSIDDFYLYGSNTKLKNREKSFGNIHNDIKINENLQSFKHKNSDLYLKSDNEDESKNSFDSLNSNISKNSKVKNLLDI